MTTKLYTAYNFDIQKYFTLGKTNKKQQIIDDVINISNKNGIPFAKLLPFGTKRYQAFDYIIYLLSVGRSVLFQGIQ